MKRWRWLIVIGLLLTGRSGATADGPNPATPLADGSPAAAGQVTLTAVIGTRPGGDASATVVGPPRTRCTIAYIMPDGRPGSAVGLGPQTTDARGRATWRWYVTTMTAPGIGTVAVACGGVTSATVPVPIGVGE